MVLLSPCDGRAGTDRSPPVPIPSADPHVLAIAKEWFFRFQRGDIDRSQLDMASNLQLTDAAIKQEEATLKAFGTPRGFRYLGSQPVQGDISYGFLILFDAGRIVESIAFDGKGKIAGIDFQTYVAE